MHSPRIGLVWLAIAQLGILLRVGPVAGGSGTRVPNGRRDPPPWRRYRTINGRFGGNANLWFNPTDSVLASEDTPIYEVTSWPGNPGGVRITERRGLMRTTAGWLRDSRHLPDITLGREPRRAEEGRVRPGRTDGTSDPRRGPIPDTVYPRVLVMADHTIYERNEGDVYAVVKQLLTMMNGVDLVYRVLENPRVRFHVAGILIATDSQATPFIARNRLDDDAFETYAAIAAASKFFYLIKDSIPVESYNIALTITEYFFGAGYNKYIVGQGFNHTVCVNRSTAEVMPAVAIVRENDAFESVYTTAHELGHVLGLAHDDSETVAANGGRCRSGIGNVMSPSLTFSRNSSYFSDCSLREFERNLWNHKLDCTFEKPRIRPGTKLPNLVPGKVRGLEAQCAAAELGPPCRGSNVCTDLHCRNKENRCQRTRSAALAGSPCNADDEAPGRYCAHFQCVRV